jgi:hypothetical protein
MPKLLNPEQDSRWFGRPCTHATSRSRNGSDSVLAGLSCMRATSTCASACSAACSLQHVRIDEPTASRLKPTFLDPTSQSEKRVNFSGSYPFGVQRGRRHRVRVLLFDGEVREAANGDEVEGS